MSGFTYFLELGTERSAAEVFDLLQDNLPFITGVGEPHPKYPRSLYTTNDGVELRVSTPRGFYPSEEAFGFPWRVRISFELTKTFDESDFARREEGKANMVRALNWIIDHIEGDMVLFATDIPILLRHGNRIWLDRRDWSWIEEDLALMTFPYEWRDLEKLMIDAEARHRIGKSST
jgi:hypothetical protein